MSSQEQLGFPDSTDPAKIGGWFCSSCKRFVSINFGETPICCRCGKPTVKHLPPPGFCPCVTTGGRHLDATEAKNCSIALEKLSMKTRKPKRIRVGEKTRIICKNGKLVITNTPYGIEKNSPSPQRRVRWRV